MVMRPADRESLPDTPKLHRLRQQGIPTPPYHHPLFDVPFFDKIMLKQKSRARWNTCGPGVLTNTNWESLRIEGVPHSNIPACSSCHGADAEGGAGLRLAGQLYDYAFKTIMNWSKEQ